MECLLIEIVLSCAKHQDDETGKGGVGEQLVIIRHMCGANGVPVQ